jgi:hypothetical protein
MISIAAVEPVADQGLDQCRRMLAIGIHEEHRAETGVIEARSPTGIGQD